MDKYGTIDDRWIKMVVFENLLTYKDEQRWWFLKTCELVDRFS
jgi:hypothetical protein